MTDDEARERIGWSLLLLGRLYRREKDLYLRQIGLSEAASAPLRYLRHRAPLRLGALAEAQGIEGPTLVGVVDQLERQGLARRGHDPIDKRARLIEITPAGSGLFDRVEAQSQALRRRLFGGISSAELQSCVEILSTVEHNLRDIKSNRKDIDI